MTTRANPAEYTAALGQLHLQIGAWLKDHPEARIRLQWKVKPGTVVISTITDAIAKGFLVVDPIGREFIDAVKIVNGSEASFLMFQAIFDQFRLP